MDNVQNIQTPNDLQFREIAFRVLEQAGFAYYSPDKTLYQPQDQRRMMKKDDHLYCVETFYSRRELYTSRAILTAAKSLIDQAKAEGCLPLIVVGGILRNDLQVELVGKSFQTVVLDVENLLYMARENRELSDKLAAQLPFDSSGLREKTPEYLPLPDWDAAYEGKNDWQITASALRPDIRDTAAPGVVLVPDVDSQDDLGEEDSSGKKSLKKPGVKKSRGSTYGIDLGTSYSAVIQLFQKNEENCLKKDIGNWKGGKQTKAAAYEKLCTRTLMRLFADDLTLWKEQAKSNDDLFRFDLICKIKRDNHKDFWEMAERYFSSKYIIFEFKNYSGKVTQKEVYTTVRYLYTKAMRGVAILISPNGIDENAGKAIRGVLRDEGKLVLSLTNDELIHMLQMKEYGEDPADYLSDKLDELLIDLEK